MRRLVFTLAAFLAPCLAEVDFTRDVQPIFLTRCQPCHGPQQQMNGLRLDTPEAVLKGSVSGKVVRPGSSAASELYQRVSSKKNLFHMPPVGDPLSAQQIAAIRDWIDQGAKTPAPDSKTKPIPLHWSFVPVRRPPLPKVRNRGWARNGIDRFILARLEAEGLAPSPEAARNTLIRRLSLDLTGLPPTPSETAAYLADARPGADERLVDRLLASPHYGERWARVWLDLAHYADSDGYEKDLVRPWAWRYRHWLIDALNRDLPYDQFTLEQLAGDLLPGATTEQKVATGFLRNTLTNREAGVDRAEARFEQVVNRTNTVSTVWLGLTAGCAQCHNHKFDPISQKDYYSLFAFFHGAAEAEIDAPLAGELEPYRQALPEYTRRREELLTKYGVAALQARWEERLREAFANPGRDLEWDFAVTEMRAGFDGADGFLKSEISKRTEREAARLTFYFLGHIGPAYERDKGAAAALKEAREKLNQLNAGLPVVSQAPVMAADPSASGANVHEGGDYQSIGIPVDPDTPAVLPPLAHSGRADRLALARWLVSRDNPLTARVAVNRMWQEFFGRGLVRSSDDFGTQGDRPSHPELLDWLAAEFVEGGWSVKRMHRMIVLSAAYRQSSRARPDVDGRDPGNALVARQARLRLPAESIRDEALAASGLLNLAIGGRSVRPPQPAGVAELGYANSVKWKESSGPDRYRRGLYIHFQRTTPYPMLANFDAPDSNTACTRRRRSNTPLQALNLLNDPVFLEAAQALAARLEREAPAGPRARIDAAFELCLARPPAPGERDRLLRLAESSGWVAVARVLLNLDEFITRE